MIPKAKVRPEQGLTGDEKKTGPVCQYPSCIYFPLLLHKSPLRRDLVEGADFVVIRELTGGIYFGEPRGRSEDQNTAYDTLIYTREEITRITETCFRICRQTEQEADCC